MRRTQAGSDVFISVKLLNFPAIARLICAGLALVWGAGARGQAGTGPSCCGPNLGAQSIAWLQLPTNTTVLLPDPSGANTAGTWIIANLPGYGNVLVVQAAPTNVNVICTNGDFGRNHSPGSFDNVPHLGGAFNFTELLPGVYGPYSWGVTPGLVALAYGHQFVTNGNFSPLPRYPVSFYFLNGKPDFCRLVFSTLGLAEFTTNTVSQPMTFRSEYDLIYDPTNYPFGPSADTVLDGVFGPPLQYDVTGTVISSAYVMNGGDDFNTGWGLFQATNDVLTAALPPGSGVDVFSNPYPGPGNYPYITVGVDHQFHDIFSLTVGYLCCSNCVTNCLQVQCASGKTVTCGSTWTFDPPTATTCCTNQIVTSAGTLTNLEFTVVDLTTNGVCPQFITQTWLITDACGNSNFCSQIVQVDGCCTNCLQVQCPTNKTVPCTSAWSFDAPTATTCCPSNIYTSTGLVTNILVTSTGFVTNGACPQLTITENWVISDGCGNGTNCSQTVTVLGCCPTNCLQVQCPTNKTVQCGSTWTFDLPTATSCCPSNFVSPAGPGTNVMITAIGTTTNGVCPQFITQNWVITDLCGNTNTCSQTVKVVDTTPPTIICPTNFLVVPLNRYCQFIIPAIQVIASDNCTPLCSLVYSQSPRAGTTNFSGNPVVVTVTVTDLCGNSNQCHVLVEALDKTGPVVTCPSSMTVTNCLVPCVPVTATDNCCLQSQLTITQSPPCGTPLGPGINTVTVTVTDCHNNTTVRIVHLVVSGPQSFLPNLFNTGVDPSHVPLADDLVDPHYALPVAAVPAGMPTDYHGNAVAVSDACHVGFQPCAYPRTATCFIYTPWDLASPVSKWIAPNYTNNGCDPGGVYTYTLNFILPAGLNLATATISGRWAADNSAGMYINSMPVPAVDGGVTPTFLSWTPFTIPPGSLFLTGPNILSFMVTNSGAQNQQSYTGLRVEFTNAFANCANCAPPVINWLTPGQSLPVGGTATFTVVAGGTPPLSYQWYHNNAPLAGDTNPTMQVHPLTLADAGIYSVVVSNPCGVVTGYVRLNVVQAVSWTNAWWNVASVARPLAATIGPDLNLSGPSTATAFAISAGTTEDFGLPELGGQPVNVMHLAPQVGATLTLPPLAPAGASEADTYSIIMDVYEPNSSFGTPSTLFQSVYCCLGSTGQDGVGLVLDDANYLHLTGAAGGVPFDAASSMPLPTGVWNRLVLVVDNAPDAPNSTVAAYLNGINIIGINPCICCIIHPFGPNLSWANGAPLVLSAPTNAAVANAEFYLASMQFHAMALDPQTVAGLGDPDSAAPPVNATSAGPSPVLTTALVNDTLTLSWSGGPFVLQETGDVTSGIWVDSTLPFSTVQTSTGTQTSATAKPKANPTQPAKFYRLVFRP